MLSDDCDKLNLLADWFDLESTKELHPEWSGTSVQKDLRRIASELQRRRKACVDAFEKAKGSDAEA